MRDYVPGAGPIPREPGAGSGDEVASREELPRRAPDHDDPTVRRLEQSAGREVGPTAGEVRDDLPVPAERRVESTPRGEPGDRDLRVRLREAPGADDHDPAVGLEHDL